MFDYKTESNYIPKSVKNPNSSQTFALTYIFNTSSNQVKLFRGSFNMYNTYV